MTGNNTYSGQTAINDGTLNVATSGNLGDASATNTLSLNGGTLRTTATLDLTANRTVAIGASGGTLSAATGTVTTVSGAVSGGGQLTAAGGGTVILSANNSGFTGNTLVTSVSGNTTNTSLRLSNANALTSGAVTLDAGVAVAGGNGNQLDLAGVSIGSGVSLIMNSVGGTNSRSTLISSSGTATWNGGVQLGGDGLTAFNNATGTTLNVNGNITATGGGFTGNHFFRGTGTGVMGGMINIPNGSIAKTDNGIWTISSTGNSWLNTQISVGTLKMGAAGVIPSNSVVTLGQNDGSNVTFDLNGFNQTIGGLSSNPTTAVTGTKAVTSATATTLTINQAADSIYGGLITGNITLVKQGAGVLTLGNTGNTFTGSVTVDGATSILAVPGNAGAAGDPTALGAGSKAINLINGGTIRITSNSNPTGTNTKMFTFGTGGGKIDAPTGVTVTLDDNTGATAQLQGAGDLTKVGAGILQLGYTGQVAGGFSGYTGNIIINAGTLQAGNANGLGSGAGSTTTVQIGGALDFYSSAATYVEDLNIAGTGPAGNGALLNSSTLNQVLNGLVTMTNDSAIGATSTGALIINGLVSGGFNLSKVGAGAGIVTLANPANTYTGTTTVAGGTLAGTTIGNVGAGNTSFGNVTTVGGGTIAVGSTTATGTLVVNAAVDSSTNRVIDLAGTTFGGGVGSSGASAMTFTSDPTYTGIGNKQFILTGSNAGNNTFAGAITDGSGGSIIGLDKTGAGTWLVTGTNGYSGPTNLAGGVLIPTNNSAFGTTSQITQTGASELRLTGGLNIGRPISITGGGITNFGAIRNFSGNNEYSGAITIAGQVRINSDAGILTLSGGSTGAAGIVFGGGGDILITGAQSYGAGLFAKADGTGTLTLNANVTNTGATSVSTGRLVLGPLGNFVGVTAATVASGAILAIGQNASGSANATAGALTLAAGSAFTMADGFTSTLNVAGATTFGGTSASSLTFDLGATADRLVSAGTAVISTAGETIAINGLAGATVGTVNLITGGAASTLATNPFTLSTTKVYSSGTPYALSLTSAATTVDLNVAAFAGLDTAYWKGDLSGQWNDVSSGTNFDTTEGGGVDTAALPTSVTDVFIHATGAANLTTQTLGQDFTVNSLNYTAASAASTIGAGNTLTLAAAGSGNVGLNVASGAAAHTINANVVLGQSQTWNQSSANTLTVGGSVSGTGTLTKTGNGTLALGGFGSNSGGLTINAGAVNLTGTYSPGALGQITLGNAAGTSLLRINGGNLLVAKTVAPSAVVGTIAGGAGAINLSSGAFTTASEVWVGSAAGAYGAITITNGTATLGSWLAVGRGGNGALNVLGGTLNVLANNITTGTIGGGSGNTNDVVNFSGSSTTNVFNGGLLLPEQQAGHVVVANLSGSATLNLGTSLSFGSGGAQVNSGVFNLNGGTLVTKSVVKGTGTGSYLFNFNGGTLKAQLGSTAAFMTGLTSAYVNSGGAIFDTNGQNITVAQNLIVPTGSGVLATGLTIGGTNSGYIDTPIVSITGGGGTGATAVAVLDYNTGAVTGITITNRGNGYTSAPTFSLIGGGGAATIGGAASLMANDTTGGLTKNGAGVLDLTGANTYTGATVVNGGGLTIGNTYPTSGVTFASGTTLGFTNSGALTVPQNLSLTTAISKSNTGTTTLSGTNSFTGASISGGSLVFSTAASQPIVNRTLVTIGGAAVLPATVTNLQNQVVCLVDGFQGGALGLNTTNATENLDLSAGSGANQVGLSIGAAPGVNINYTGTITPNGTTYRLGGGGAGGTLTLGNTNALTGPNSLNFLSSAGGDVNLTGINNYTGGTTLAGGANTYNLFFSNGSLGSGPITFSGASTLVWNTGNTQDLSAGRTISVNNTSVLNTNGNNVVFGSPIGNFGTGQLTKAGGGNLTLSGVNTYTGQTNITGGTLILANGARINSNVVLTVANSLVLGGATATIGGLSGAFNEAILNGSTLTIGANNSSQSYPNVLSGTGSGLTKIGAATQTLTGANTYTGSTTIQMGNLTSGQLVSSNLNLAFATGALTNRLAATTPLVLGGSVASDAQTILGGGTLTLTGVASTTNSQTVNGLTIGAGNNNIVLAANATANPLALTLGAITRNVGGTLHITQPTGTLSATNGVQTTSGTAATILTSAAGTAYATIGANVAGAYGWAGKNAGGFLDAAAVTYSPATTAGTFTANADVTATFTATNPTTVNSIRMNSATAFTVTNGVTTVSTGGVLFGSTAVQTLAGGTLKPGTGNELVFINTNTGSPAINSVLADGAGSSSVTYRALIGATATGQFALGGTNLYTGPTYITSGRIATAAVAQPFGTGANAKVYIDGNTNGQWFGTGAATVANPFLITGNGWSEANGPFGAIRIDNGIILSGGVTLLGDAGIGDNAGTGTISGPISGAFNLTKLIPGGNLALTGTNTLTGKFVSQAGNIIFNSAAAYGSSTGISLTGGGVTQSGAFTGIQANLINKLVLNPVTGAAPNGTIGFYAGTASENVDFSSSTIDLSNVYLGGSASGTYTGTITPYNNAYKIGGGGSTNTFSNTNAFVDNGAIPRSVAVRNNTTVISGTNTYSGGTTTLSTIQFANGALGSGPITVAGGGLAWAIGGNTQDITAGGRAVTFTGAASLDTFGNNVILSGPLALNTTGAISKLGGGVLTLNGVSTTNAASPVFATTVGGITFGVANAMPYYTTLGFANTAGVVGTVSANQTVGAIGNNASATYSSAASLALANGTTLTYGYNNTSTNTGTDAVISGGGNLVKVGTGSQYLRTVESYTGSLEVNNGFQLLEFAQVAANTNNIILPGKAVTLSGGTLQLLGNITAASTNTQTLTSNIVLNPGASAVGVNSRTGQTTTFALNGFTRNAGSTVNVLPNGGGASFVAAVGTGVISTNQSNTDYTSTGGNQSILGGYAGFSATAAVVNTLNTPTTWAVSANAAANTTITGLASFSSTFTAGTNVDAALGNVSTGNGALAINSLRFNTAGAYQVDAANGLSVASGGILATAAIAANPISILNGTLTSGNGADLIVHQYSTGDFIIGSKITGGIALTKSGPGRLVLANGANDYTGATYVNAGILRYNASTTATSASALVHSGAAIELIDGATVTGQTATVYGTGSGNALGALNVAYGSATWAGGIVLGDIESRIGAASQSTLTVSGNIVDGAVVNDVISNKLWLNGGAGGNANGTIVLSGAANTYSGTTAIIRGIVRITGNDILPTTTTLDVHSGGNNFGATTDASIFDLNGYNQTVSGLARTDTTGAGTITNWAAGASTLTVNNAVANTYSGNITESYGKISLVKSGAGNLTLSGNNTFSGGLTINGGTILMGSANAIGSQAQPNALTMTGGTLDANGIAEVNLAKLNGAAGTITDSGATAGTTTLSFGSSTTDSFAGSINDGAVRNLAVVKGGTGTQNLTGSSSYSGVTAISGGVLNAGTFANVNLPSSIGKGSVAGSNRDLLIMGGTLQYTGSAAQSSDRLFSITNAGGALDASGSNNANALNLSGTGAMGFGGTTGARTLTLTGSNTGNNTLASVIGDQAAVTGITTLAKTGPGTWVLSGTNTYTGATNVNEGTLIFAVSETLTSLNIADGATAILGAPSMIPPPAPADAFIAASPVSAQFEAASGSVAGVAAVPEPGSAALLVGGILSLLGVRRRRA